jgi:hypothetical protein
MDPLFVDTNVVIRFRTQDDPDEAASAKSSSIESGPVS